MKTHKTLSFLTKAAVLCALPLLAACDLEFPGRLQSSAPVRAPAPPVTSPEAARAEANSEALRDYYARVLNDGMTRGLLRTDGGGPDTPYTDTMLLRNFEQIAFFSEYERGVQPLRRWVSPVRIKTHFGQSIAPQDKLRDANAVASFASRLARITRHPVSMNSNSPNFHVFFANEIDRPSVIDTIQRIEPGINAATLRSIQDLPRSTYCLVIAFTQAGQPGVYTRAIAIIRGEQPDLMRLSCIHEELAQGLGLANDSPFARPSIFNDDDEFALLTSHDEVLLRALYSPALRAGMSMEAARPILQRVIADSLPGNS